MMERMVSVVEGSGVMDEVADVIRITLIINGASDSNFFFF